MEVKIIKISVQWLDAYLEVFEVVEVQFEDGLLWLEIPGGNRLCIPLCNIRWFAIEKSQNTDEIISKAVDEVLSSRPIDKMEFIKNLSQQQCSVCNTNSLRLLDGILECTHCGEVFGDIDQLPFME